MKKSIKGKCFLLCITFVTALFSGCTKSTTSQEVSQPTTTKIEEKDTTPVAEVSEVDEKNEETIPTLKNLDYEKILAEYKESIIIEKDPIKEYYSIKPSTFIFGIDKEVYLSPLIFISSEGIGIFSLTVRYDGDDWIYMDDIIIKGTSDIYEKSFDNSKVKTSVSGGDVYESIFLDLTDSERVKLLNIFNSGKILVRASGSNGYADTEIQEDEKNNVVCLLECYELLIEASLNTDTNVNAESISENNISNDKNRIFSIESDATPTNVQNDVTGRWKKILISENISIEDKALDYYNAYFNDDNEIHAIVNFANNTTTKISVLGTYLDVTTYEYVKGEENDANLMFSGMLLKEYSVDINTGEIEEIQ